jgi:hypothetical protein
MYSSIRLCTARGPSGWRHSRHGFLALGFVLASAMSITAVRAQELCGGTNYPFPYTDVSGVGAAFCPGIMEAYVTGVSKGTTPTTFSPNSTVTRVQMTTFLQRSLDQALKRTSRRAALNQWWTSQTTNAMQTISIGNTPLFCAVDSENIWTVNGSQLVQVEASTGTKVGTWTGATVTEGVLVAAGKVFVTGGNSPGTLYFADPTLAPTTVTTAASNLSNQPAGIAFDGTHIWTANRSGSVSIITPQASTPYPVTNVSAGFTQPYGILFDGANIWVTDLGASTLLKLDPAGAILQTVPVGSSPENPVFDGANIWVPNGISNSITVVQASTGNVVATIPADASNLLNAPKMATFDGERVLVVNNGNTTVTLFKAADLSFIANVPIEAGSSALGACSDGINFWVPSQGTGNLLRF